MNNTNATKHNLKPFSQGLLYIVATPIGNLGDITIRALDVLKNVDFIACEDTRQTMKLLSHYGVKTKCLVYHDHSKEKEIQKIIDILLSGKNVAVVSDAGTPLISDPGYSIINQAIASQIPVVPIPGACAAIAALSVAGISSDSFVFLGFLPNSQKHRKDKLEEYATVKSTLITYESPKRIKELLTDIHLVLGDRQVVLARELTKLYEEVRRGKVSELLSEIEELKGECVVIIEGAQDIAISEEQIVDALKSALKSNSLKDAVDFVTTSLKCPRKKVYSLALNISKNLK
jgi:16S rRNA (cytidine1402-2'-O)-methyltransferase